MWLSRSPQWSPCQSGSSPGVAGCTGASVEIGAGVEEEVDVAP